MKDLGTVKLETSRLILRRATVDDAPAMFRNWASDPEVTKFLTWPAHKDVSQCREYIQKRVDDYEKDDTYNWFIELKETGELIGSISVVDSNPTVESVHVGYCLGKKWWHTGITSEAFSEVIRFFFEDVGVNRIDSRHDTRNPNSGKVMQKCGLTYEGTLRQSDRNCQGICDAAWYAILKDEYFAK